MAADDDALAFERLDGAAHRPDADPEEFGQTVVGGQLLAGFPFAVGNAAADAALHQQILVASGHILLMVG